MYLEVKNLKIIQIDDGEQHYIVAETKEKAKDYFLKEMNFEDIQACDLSIIEIEQDEDIQVNLSQDNDLLLQLINRYRKVKDKVQTINIWDFLKFIILEKKLQDKVLETPFVISSSVF